MKGRGVFLEAVSVSHGKTAAVSKDDHEKRNAARPKSRESFPASCEARVSQNEEGMQARRKQQCVRGTAAGTASTAPFKTKKREASSCCVGEKLVATACLTASRAAEVDHGT